MAKQPASSHEKYEGDGQQGQVDKGQKKETTLSLEAKMAKLRRVCEKKPSGKVKVPEEVHLKWKQNNGDDRAELLKALEDSNWDKDTFVAKVTRTVAKTNKLTKNKRRQWHSEESMFRVLNWSKPYIKSVVAYCRKAGNEKLIKKDRYNKKIDKFHVVVEEQDDEVSDLEETEKHEATKDSNAQVAFKLKASGSMEPPQPGDSSGTDASDDEEEAKQTNGPKQEFDRFKTFANSLLGRSSKISDLISELEGAAEIAKKGSETSDGQRVAKLVTKLEEAAQTLDAEHVKCECVKAAVSKLIAKIDEQVSATTIACSKITATESAAKKLECNSSFSNFPVHLHETYKTYMIISQSGTWGVFVFGSWPSLAIFMQTSKDHGSQPEEG
ncbi:unnamed protein product [Cladocopium goreaui]|uniref:Uncharacterized protein n=1 Tax=Cladocopium goreaui TaxID=2562237 RepID=A0A9P1C8T7_9DINO|nr:unnamed protein product [Cladocopium goreaui]